MTTETTTQTQRTTPIPPGYAAEFAAYAEYRQASDHAQELLERLRPLLPQSADHLWFELDSAVGDRESNHCWWLAQRLIRLFPHLSDVIEWACMSDAPYWQDFVDRYDQQREQAASGSRTSAAAPEQGEEEGGTQ